MRSFDRALPDSHDPPSSLNQIARRRHIANPIYADFFQPEVGAGGGNLEKMTTMAMPEASMHKHDAAMSR